MSLKRSHPLPVFVYLALSIIYTMFTKERAVLAISLGAGFITQAFFVRIRIKPLLWNLSFFLLIVLFNPLFNQNGTPLFQIGTLKITEEALLAGLDIALMVLAVVHWFNIFNVLLGADKFIQLFGKVSPNSVLLVSMGLKYVPEFARRSERIGQAQKALGIYEEGFFGRIRNRIKTFVALLSWSLENAVDTALAMKARGFGSRKRTSYGPYRVRKSDILFLALVSGSFLFLISPHLKILCASLFFCGGIILEIKEAVKWRCLLSKI